MFDFINIPAAALRSSIRPGLRGALFYGAYWGVVGALDPFLGVYYLGLGLTGPQIGWLYAILPLFTLLVPPFLTRYAQQRSRRVALLALSLIGFGLSTLLVVFPKTFFLLLPTIALMGIFRSSVIPLGDGLVAQMASHYQLDYGRMRLWGSITYTLTAIGFGAVWAITGFVPMFIGAGLLFLPVAFSGLILDEGATPLLLTVSPAKESKTPRDLGLMLLLAATVMMGASMFMSGNFSGITMKLLGGNELMIGALVGISALCEVPSMMFGSRLARRMGDTTTLLLGYLLTAAGLLGWALAREPGTMLAFTGLKGLGYGFFIISTVTSINRRAPQYYSAMYQGILNALGWGLAPLIGGPVSGLIFERLGYSALFNISGLMAVFAMLLVLPNYWLWRRKPASTMQVERPVEVN